MKKIKILAGALALCAIAGTNIYVACIGLQSSNLNISNVETVAEGWEWGGWSNFWDGYGFLKDEQPYGGQCPMSYSSGNSNSNSNSNNVNGGYGGVTVGAGSSYSYSGSNNYSVQYGQNQNPGNWIKCMDGNSNCDEQECWHP